jgi:hypothetical protein
VQAPEGLQFWAAEGMALATIYRITDLLYMLGSEKLKKTNNENSSAQTSHNKNIPKHIDNHCKGLP